jgi:long-chain fatty acid transport protein
MGVYLASVTYFDARARCAASPRSVVRLSARLIVLCVCSAPLGAQAGGFASARFGGEHGTAADTLPSAIYYNPGAIGLLDGQQLMFDAAFALRTAEYTRSADAIDASTLTAVESAGLSRADATDALTGRASLSDWVVLPFAGVVSDLGLKRVPLRVGAAFFVPFGGQSSWDERAANAAFPGAVDGPARWYNIEGTIRSLAGSLDAAYRIDAARLAIGVSGTLYFQQVETVRARNANATDNLVAPDGTLVEGRSLLDVSGTAAGVGVGVLWEAIARRMWLGASYQSQPGFGTMELDGTLTNTLGSARPAQPVDVVFTEELPDIVRIAARGRPLRVLELRVELSWERWSQLDQMCLADAGASDLEAACATRADGSQLNSGYASDVVQVFARDWHDTFGARIGASYFAGHSLELLLGAGFDSSAIPDRTLDPSLFDMNKLLLAAGVTYTVGAVALSLTVSDAIYFERDTRGVEGNESLALPSRQPANEGVFAQNTLLLQPAVGLSF